MRTSLLSSKVRESSSFLGLRRLRLCFALGGLFWLYIIPIVQAASWIEAPAAELQLLDKITARISTMTIKVGGSAVFGTLELQLHHCAYRPPEEPPENAAFLVILDQGYEEPANKEPAFSGWMFASSPAISGLEHPVYDVTLLSCHKE